MDTCLQVPPTQVILYEGPDDGPGLLLLAVVDEDVAPLGHGHGSERGAVSLGPAPAASVRLLGHVASEHGHTWHGTRYLVVNGELRLYPD